MKRIQKLSLIFMVGMFLSGLSAIPLVAELDFAREAMKLLGVEIAWVFKVHNALIDTSAKYPFLFYGTDWLAFAHFLFALLFVGVYKDPLRNIWVTKFCIIACFLIFPFAFIMGSIRGIPIYWQLIDCSFGVIGLMILYTIKRLTLKLNNYENI